MKTILKPKDMDVVILCGGFARRLGSILGKLPKAMAKIKGRPFLDILIEYIAGFGFRRFILCTGYRGDIIKEYYSSKRGGPFEFVFSQEDKPLGTAGAVRNACGLIRSPLFLVTNGDSLCRIDLRKFISFHLQKDALISIALTHIKDKADYGNVILDKEGRVINFSEKPVNDKGNLVSAGIYLFQNKTVSLVPKDKNISLERDFFPKMASKRFYGYATNKILVDIGTPKRFKKARGSI